jgi:hypothetical protein
LGVKPGASTAELKAAYRDMAKVWHPDRFGHDERLQKKAQEMLKEINEAYEQLISGKTPRPRSVSSHEEERNRANGSSRDADLSRWNTASSKSSRTISSPLIILAVLIFSAGFFVTTRSLLRQRLQQNSIGWETSLQGTEPLESGGVSRENDNEPRRSRSEAESKLEEKADETATAQTSAAPLQPMTMVTVLIDPSSGLLAKAECPVKTKMTYPSGSEPRSVCSTLHPPKSQADSANDSRVRSFAKRVASPGKWLGSGSKEKSEGEK